MDLEIIKQNQSEGSLFDSLLISGTKKQRKTTFNSDMIQEEISYRSEPNDESFPEEKWNPSDIWDDLPIEKKVSQTQQLNEIKDSEAQKQSPKGEIVDQEVPKKSAGYDVTGREAKHIFRKKNIKKQTKKNTNFPKFLIRLFLKYTEKSDLKTQESQQHFQFVLRSFNKRKTNNYNIPDVKLMLGLINDQNCDKNCKVNKQLRQHLANLLRITLNKEILQNNYVSRNKTQYLIASKIYRLRCRSSILPERIQNK